jgi:hypothetical protein
VIYTIENRKKASIISVIEKDDSFIDSSI